MPAVARRIARFRGSSCPCCREVKLIQASCARSLFLLGHERASCMAASSRLVTLGGSIVNSSIKGSLARISPTLAFAALYSVLPLSPVFSQTGIVKEVMKEDQATIKWGSADASPAAGRVGMVVDGDRNPGVGQHDFSHGEGRGIRPSDVSSFVGTLNGCGGPSKLSAVF